MMPTMVELLMLMRVGGCRWPRYSKVSRSTFASIVLRNSVPSLALAVEAAQDVDCTIEDNGFVRLGDGAKKKYACCSVACIGAAEI